MLCTYFLAVKAKLSFDHMHAELFTNMHLPRSQIAMQQYIIYLYLFFPQNFKMFPVLKVQL